MPVPTLPHPIAIRLAQIDPTASPKRDPQYREPIDKPVFKASVKLTAQFAPGATERFRQQPGGDDPQSDGHFTLRKVDVAREAPDLVPHKGDRITALYADTPDERAVHLVVEEVAEAGHYPRLGSTLWVLRYRDMKTQAQVR